MNPQFGTPMAGREHRDRPAVFGILIEDEKLALVRITLADGTPPYFDLPGGAIDPGETARQALVREFAEETGLVVSAGPAFARAAQYFVKSDGEAVNNLCSFHRVEREPGIATKVEDDHELVWCDPVEALRMLRHEAHAWGLAAFMRTARSQGW